MNILIIYQSENRIGGDNNFAKIYTNSLSKDYKILSLTDQFSLKHILVNLFYFFKIYGPRGILLPLSCILSEIKGASRIARKYTKFHAVHIVGPRISHLALMFQVRKVCMVDFTPLSYKNASRNFGFIFKALYAYEASRYLRLIKLIPVPELIYFSERDSRFSRLLAKKTSVTISLGKRTAYKPKLPIKNKKYQFVFIANFESQLNRLALENLNNKYAQFDDALFSKKIIISGYKGDKLRNQSFQFVPYDQIVHVINDRGKNFVGFCYMPASAGKQNKIYDYIRFQIPMILDKRSQQGLGAKVLKNFVVDDLNPESVVNVLSRARIISKTSHEIAF